MMLDRGELKDWFGSTEIWIEATIAGLCFYLFVVHTATATDRSFLNRALLKDANCVAGTLLMFLVGIPLYGTMTLLPTMLQDLMNYPVVTTGLVTAPRGVGTMIAMILVARLVGRIDTRLLILAGLVADRGSDVADDRVFAAHGDGPDHHDRGDAGLRTRVCLHAAEHHHLLDLAAEAC